MAKDDIYQVTTTFVITLGDRDVEYHAGEVVDGDDPAFKRVPEHFGPVAFKHRTAKPIEQATAAPGEKRNVVHRAVRKVTKPKAAEPPAGKAITTAGFKGRT